LYTSEAERALIMLEQRLEVSLARHVASLEIRIVVRKRTTR
jgi:hypothetical protein